MMDLSVEYTLDQTESLTLTVPADDPKAYTLEVDKELQFDGRLWFIEKLHKVRNESVATITATGAPLWVRLNDRVIVGTLTIEALTVADWLDVVLAGSGWVRGAATTTDDTVWVTEAQDETVLWWLRQISAMSGYFLRFDTLTKTVDLTEQQGRDLGTGFRYGRNLQTIEHIYQAPRVTRLYPFGRDSIDVTASNAGEPYIEDYSWYTGRGLTLAQARERFTKEEVFSGDEFITEDALMSAARAYLTLAAQPIVEYSMTVTDLSGLLGVTDLDVNPGDTVTVRDAVLGIEVSTTVVRVVRYPLEPARNTVELSHLYSAAAEIQQRARTQATLAWHLFVDTTQADYQLRNENLYVVNRIPIIFAPGGEAVHGVSVTVTPVGTGSLSISAMDAETSALVHPIVTVPTVDGVKLNHSFTFAQVEQEGQKDFQIRMISTSGDGASSATGVDIEPGAATYWILARGAVERRPQSSGSQTFFYTGDVQTFTVPAAVTEITVEAFGAPGEFAGANRLFYWERPGFGAYVKGVFQVEPLDVLDVYVGGRGRMPTAFDDGGGWPNGGGGGNWSSDGSGGGGSSHVVPQGGGIAAALLVAPGGGGMSPFSAGQRNYGGSGRFFHGDAGHYPEYETNPLSVDPPYGTLTGEELDPFYGEPGGGASQFAGGDGGAGELGRPAGGAGSFGQGGDADPGNPLEALLGAAGGGGGWFGGGGGGTPQGPGGGGSGHMRWDGTNRTVANGVRGPELTRPDRRDPQSFTWGPNVDGEVTISWKVDT